MNLKLVGEKSIGKAEYYYRGDILGVMQTLRQACWDVNKKSIPGEMITVESEFQKMMLMTEYHLGVSNVKAMLMLSLAFAGLQDEEKDPMKIGLPPEWPGE